MEDNFTKLEKKDSKGKTIGYSMRCNTCDRRDTFEFKDRMAHGKLKVWLAIHSHNEEE